MVSIGFLCKTALSLPVALGRSARPLLNRLYFAEILCIFIEICWSIPTWCDAPPRGPLTFPQLLRQVVRPGAQQASWSPEPSFSLILQGFSSPGVMRNRSGSDLEGVGGRTADMEGLGAFSTMLECIIIDVEPSIRDIFIDSRTSVWSCYGNFQAHFQISYDSIMTLGLIFRWRSRRDLGGVCAGGPSGASGRPAGSILSIKAMNN